ncbi:hypothetical protein VOLCADRAFT_101019 [Volvox carteri f. nagariensis]|uniref:Uncharacterized protein n=1 Tax=Volvox carteri f. nagariensis TaxID=3068 RepID=D8ULJ7_VOLCA|nr:uncharacterized protein VOLCADRAFT_101019 [Volvox carteri f. nagariensis]EFJ39402.1 hypothetical protein VOLCADRAFT_101019 [Volvox carteri f. nagariensis]|eukprot:XP_002959533.1 hypothetical protein VOLCADRAFT_101019 [Volvox carteri f. nagariensis]
MPIAVLWRTSSHARPRFPHMAGQQVGEPEGRRSVHVREDEEVLPDLLVRRMAGTVASYREALHQHKATKARIKKPAVSDSDIESEKEPEDCLELMIEGFPPPPRLLLLLIPAAAAPAVETNAS